jgi:glycosyltransferase involved in cell wall biosynthesis
MRKLIGKLLRRGRTGAPAVADEARHPLVGVIESAYLEPWPSGYTANLITHGGETYERLCLGNVVVRFHLAALGDKRGIGRYTRELLRQFRSMAALHPADGRLAEATEVHFFSTIHWCPTLLPPNSTVVIQDIAPLLLPDHFRLPAREWEEKFRHIAHQAAGIITISESSRRDIARLLGIPLDRLLVVKNGVTRFPQARPPSFPLPIDPYFVFLGACDVHKNIDVVLQALQLSKAFSLVCVGDPVLFREKLADWPGEVADRVRIAGYLGDAELAHVIMHSTALVFPSLYEGFGLPPLEAALLGVPSICSDRPAMNDLQRGAALFCPVDDAAEWRAAMWLLIRDERCRESIAARAHAIATDLTWQNAAQEIASFLGGELVTTHLGHSES